MNKKFKKRALRTYICIIPWQRFKSEDFFDSVQANQERNQ